MLTAETLMLMGGVAAFTLTISWVRSRRLKEQYALVWLAVALCLLIVGLIPDIVKAAAEACRLSYPAAVLFAALAVVYLFAMWTSMALSREQRITVRLMQDMALLDHKVRGLERQLREAREQS